jgi:trigger factor
MTENPGVARLEVTVEKLEGHKVKLDITVSAEAVARAYDRAYRTLAGKVSIPGFRKGKVPRPVLERHIGSAPLREEALDLILNDSYSQALDEKDLDPINRPNVEVVKFEEGEPMVYHATVEVKPEVKLGTYTGMDLVVEPKPVEMADVERQLGSIREKFAELEPAEADTPVADGLFAVMDFHGKIDGAGFSGGDGEGVLVQIGAGQLEAEFEEALKGAKAGDTRECALTFGSDHPNAELAGKTANFKIEVKEVKRKKLPELTDELAEEVAKTDLAGLRERITKGLEENARREAREELARQVVEKVVTHAEVDVPDTLLNRRIERKSQDMNERLAGQGLTVERYLEMVGLDHETWEKDLRARAEHEIRRDLVLEAVAKKENIGASDAEVEFEIVSLAASHGEKPERIREFFHTSPGRLESLREGIIARKTVQYLVRENVAEVPEPPAQETGSVGTSETGSVETSEIGSVGTSEIGSVGTSEMRAKGEERRAE